MSFLSEKTVDNDIHATAGKSGDEDEVDEGFQHEVDVLLSENAVALPTLMTPNSTFGLIPNSVISSISFLNLLNVPWFGQMCYNVFV